MKKNFPTVSSPNRFPCLTLTESGKFSCFSVLSFVDLDFELFSNGSKRGLALSDESFGVSGPTIDKRV